MPPRQRARRRRLRCEDGGLLLDQACPKRERRRAHGGPAGARGAAQEVRKVDPWFSFRTGFESAQDTRVEGPSPVFGGSFWVNPRGGAANVRQGSRGFTFCSGLRGRRADLRVEGPCPTLGGVFRVVLRDHGDVARLQDALLCLEAAPPQAGATGTGLPSTAGDRDGDPTPTG